MLLLCIARALSSILEKPDSCPNDSTLNRLALTIFEDVGKYPSDKISCDDFVNWSSSEINSLPEVNIESIYDAIFLYRVNNPSNMWGHAGNSDNRASSSNSRPETNSPRNSDFNRNGGAPMVSPLRSRSRKATKTGTKVTATKNRDESEKNMNPAIQVELQRSPRDTGIDSVKNSGRNKDECVRDNGSQEPGQSSNDCANTAMMGAENEKDSNGAMQNYEADQSAVSSGMSVDKADNDEKSNNADSIAQSGENKETGDDINKESADSGANNCSVDTDEMKETEGTEAVRTDTFSEPPSKDENNDITDGMLEIHKVALWDLKDIEGFFGGKMDPFAELILGDGSLWKHSTSVQVEGGVEVTWDNLNISGKVPRSLLLNQELVIIAKDRNMVTGGSQTIGQGTIDVSRAVQKAGKWRDVAGELRDGKGHPAGKYLVSMQYCTESVKPDSVEEYLEVCQVAVSHFRNTSDDHDLKAVVSIGDGKKWQYSTPFNYDVGSESVWITQICGEIANSDIVNGHMRVDVGSKDKVIATSVFKEMLVLRNKNQWVQYIGDLNDSTGSVVGKCSLTVKYRCDSKTVRSKESSTRETTDSDSNEHLAAQFCKGDNGHHEPNVTASRIEESSVGQRSDDVSAVNNDCGVENSEVAKEADYVGGNETNAESTGLSAITAPDKTGDVETAADVEEVTVDEPASNAEGLEMGYLDVYDMHLTDIPSSIDSELVPYVEVKVGDGSVWLHATEPARDNSVAPSWYPHFTGKISKQDIACGNILIRLKTYNESEGDRLIGRAIISDGTALFESENNWVYVTGELLDDGGNFAGQYASYMMYRHEGVDPCFESSEDQNEYGGYDGGPALENGGGDWQQKVYEEAPDEVYKEAED